MLKFRLLFRDYVRYIVKKQSGVPKCRLYRDYIMSTPGSAIMVRKFVLLGNEDAGTSMHSMHLIQKPSPVVSWNLLLLVRTEVDAEHESDVRPGSDRARE